MYKSKRLVPFSQAAVSIQSPCEWEREPLQSSTITTPASPRLNLTAGSGLWQECESQKLLSDLPAVLAPQYPGLSYAGA